MAACEQERNRTLFVDGIRDCRDDLAFASRYRAGEATLSDELSSCRRFSGNVACVAIFRRRAGVGASHGADGRDPSCVSRRRRAGRQAIGNSRRALLRGKHGRRGRGNHWCRIFPDPVDGITPNVNHGRSLERDRWPSRTADRATDYRG